MILWIIEKLSMLCDFEEGSTTGINTLFTLRTNS